MLGSWCFKGVIPWDDDLDFTFPRAHVPALKKAALDMGWQFMRLHPFHAKIWDPKAALYPAPRGKPWTWPFIDIALYDDIKVYKTILIEFGYCRHFKALPIADFLPTRLHPFGLLMLPIPNHPEKYLDTVYKSWRTKALSNHYNHRIEDHYPEKPVWADISELKDKFTFYNVAHVPQEA